MNASDLDTLLRDVEELRRAIRRNSPFLREVITSRTLAFYVLLFSLVVIAFCLLGQVLVGSYGSFAAIPQAWKTGLWLAVACLGVTAAAVKFLLLGRRAAQVDTRATLLTVVRVMYGGLWFNLYVPAFLCMAAASIFAVTLGHPWYIVPAIAVFYGFAANGVGLFVQRPEFFITGWYAFAAGLTSVFFLEAAPFVWTAIVYGGISLVFGIVGLAAEGKRPRNPSAGKG